MPLLPTSAGFAVGEGMDYEQALRAITINPAKICKLDDRVGSLETGKDADILVFDGDPLAVANKPKNGFCRRKTGKIENREDVLVREVQVSEITKLVKEHCIRANKILPCDVECRMRELAKQKAAPWEKRF